MRRTKLVAKMKSYISGLSSTAEGSDQLIHLWSHVVGVEGFMEYVMRFRPGSLLEEVLGLFLDSLPPSITQEQKADFLRKVLATIQAIQIARAAEDRGIFLSGEEEGETKSKIKWSQPTKGGPPVEATEDGRVTVIEDPELEEKLGGKPHVPGQLTTEEIVSAQNQIRRQAGFRPILPEEMEADDANEE